MRRSILGLTALGLGLGVSLTACGSTAPTEDPTAPAAESAGDALVVWADSTRTDVIATVAEQFTADTGVAIEVVQRDFGKMRDDFISQAPSGSGPDVLIGSGDWTGKLVQNGVLAPVQLGDAADGFLDVALDSVRYEGQVYGVPYALENLALFRNPALAPEPPGTFDEALETGRAAVEAGEATYPFLIQVDPTNGDPYHLFPVQMSFGAPVFGQREDGTADPDDLAMAGPEGEAFAAYVARLGAEGVLSTSITADIAKEAFLAGESPYFISGPWNSADIVAAVPEVVVEAVPSAGGLPAAPFVGTQAFFVSAKSTNPLAANQFVVTYLGALETQLALYDVGGRPPALAAAAADPAVAGDPVVAGFAAVGTDGVAMPNTPAMDAVWSDWGTTQVALIRGQGDPVELWTSATDSIRQKIADAG